MRRAENPSLAEVGRWTNPSKLREAADHSSDVLGHDMQALIKRIALVTRRRHLVNAYIKAEVRIRLHAHRRLPSIHPECCDFAFVVRDKERAPNVEVLN